MQYYFFHLMSWPYLPADFDQKYDSAWVWLPNSLYDPVKGHDLYREYINTLAYADELGFDGICVNEHHQNAYGLMPSPNVIAGALTQRTKQVQDRRHRQRPAAVQSAAARRRGIRHARRHVAAAGSSRAWSSAAGRNISPTASIRPCPREVPRGPRPDRQGLDDAGAVPVELEALPLPLRQSLAEAAAAAASADLDSRRRQPGNHRVRRPAALRYMGIPYFHIDVFRRVFAQFREACQKAGYTAAPEQMGWGVPIYVAETDKQAREEFEPHLWYFVRNLLKGIGLAPPGYTSPRSAAGHLREPQLVPGRAEDLGRHREGRLRHRRQPGDGAAEAGALPEGTGRRRGADRLPDGRPAA